MEGTVIDLGGKKINRRGEFRPIEAPGTQWIYVNISTASRPDVQADIQHAPFRDASADCIICCEVLEHVPSPEQCVVEMLRILKPGGKLIMSLPFLYPIHGDPGDYNRFTPHQIEKLCGGFQQVTIEPMGGYWGTMGMLLEIGARSMRGFFLAPFLRRSLRLLGRVLVYMDLRSFTSKPELGSFSTGYFCIATKDQLPA